jgi:hypothetical protein
LLAKGKLRQIQIDSVTIPLYRFALEDPSLDATSRIAGRAPDGLDGFLRGVFTKLSKSAVFPDMRA